MVAVKNRGEEAAVVRAGELATSPTLADVAAGRVDALHRLGGLEHVLHTAGGMTARWRQAWLLLCVEDAAW